MGTPQCDSLCLGDKLLASINSAYSLNQRQAFKPIMEMRSHSMPQQNEMTPLGLKILDHWKHHRPKMVKELQSQKRLEEAVFAAQELTTDVLHDLAVIQNMDYQAAWEIATREWAFLPDEGSGANFAERAIRIQK
jgi:hypothetical protein